MPARRRRILFVSEAVTLAQVVRLLVLARSLPPDEFEVHFASARFDDLVFAGTTFPRWPIFSLDAATVERRVRGGRRIYGARVLRRYLAEDRRVLASVRPDVVVGDLRLSLSVAAPGMGIPYAALINAYWSPFALRPGFPLPDHPIVRLLGERLAARYFPRALPWVFDHFAAPINRLRRQNGQPEIGSLPQVLTFGDLTLHPDPPGLTPTAAGAPRTHRHLGPLLWAPSVPLPPWWARLDRQRPTVYVTLGSSGRTEVLPAALGALADLGLQVLLSTAGRDRRASGVGPGDGDHLYVADYLPGDQAAARADLVISNGGSTTSYQALAAGKPVVGIASNLDQYLAMDAISRAGAGRLVRAGGACRRQIARVVAEALASASLRQAAQVLAPQLASTAAPVNFQAALRSV
jgi:UDP:flavonoid glycosyltransferase YjiC (YdhE family)